MNVDSLITTRCTYCGDVDLLAEQMWLVLTEPRERNHFAFRCPECEQVTRHQADDETVSVLVRLSPSRRSRSLPRRSRRTGVRP